MTERPDSPVYRIASDVVLGERVRLNAFINLYGCRIGDDAMIGTFVEIQRDVRIGPLVDGDSSGGVGDEHGRGAVGDTERGHGILNLARDIDELAAVVRMNRESLHVLSAVKYCDAPGPCQGGRQGEE